MAQAAESYLQLPRRRYFSALELHAAAIGSIAAAVLIVGYGFNFAPLQTLLPDFPAMRPRTAAVIMALSLSYMLSLRDSRRSMWMSNAVAGAVVLWILYMRINWAANTAETPWSTLPSDGTIFCLLFAGISLLIINLAPRFALVAGLLAIVAATPALFRILSLILFRGAPDGASPLNSMALHTAAVIVWFMLVCVMLHPRLGFARATLQASLRGRLLRRALPIVVALPVLASSASLASAAMFGWSVEALFALNATVGVVLGALLIWWLSSLVEDWQKEANDQASRLSRANEALEQYASSAAHDLKAPARHVLLYGELLEQVLKKGDLETARKHASSVRESAAEMPVMIEGMLDYSRSAFMRLNRGDHWLSELVQAAASQHAAELQSAGAQVTVVHEARLRCDSTLMTTVLQNLIANAIRNQRRDRPLAIRVDAVREGETWKVSVEDTGTGFDPDFAVVAFNPLARGVHTRSEGSGIGLSTCRNIIQSHGGQIRVDPGYRMGARIEFTLPIAQKPD